MSRVLTGALLALLLLAAPAQAAPLSAERKAGAPGSLTGYAFDACTTPSQEVMDAWWEASPYSAVGVYIGGSNRKCDQPELTAAWVTAQQRRGWHLLPLQVGPQASCSGYVDVMSSDQPTAEAQGRAEATAAVASATALGIGKGSTLYYDLEDYDTQATDCRRAALSFMSGWTKQLHAAGYDSGVYSNIAAAIASLDLADRVSTGSYAMPDDIWFAWANGKVDTVADPKWVASHRWDDHARIHQYRLDTKETYGGFQLTVDASWADVGTGSVPPNAKPVCKGTDVDLARYPKLRRGSHGPAVEALQCLLRHGGYSSAPITGRYDATTAAGVTKAQRKLGLKQTGKTDRRTWVALLARGRSPLAKVGSVGEPVLRLQRALGAALGKRVAVDGVFTQKTERAVRKYQKTTSLPRTGVVADQMWERLLQGR